MMKTLWSILTGHDHYWGVPHLRGVDSVMIQTCYDCSKDRECLDLRPSQVVEEVLSSASTSVTTLASTGP